MLGRSSPCKIFTGAFKCRDPSIANAIDGGAEADNAINGALVSALRPPIRSNEVLKSEPLSIIPTQ